MRRHRRARRLPRARRDARITRRPAHARARRRARRRRDAAALARPARSSSRGQCGVDYEIRVPPGRAGPRRRQRRRRRGRGPRERPSRSCCESSAGDVTATASPRRRSGCTQQRRRRRRARPERRADRGRVVGRRRARLAALVPPLSLDADSSAGDVEVVVPDEVYRRRRRQLGRRRRRPRRPDRSRLAALDPRALERRRRPRRRPRWLATGAIATIRSIGTRARSAIVGRAP